MRDKNREGGKNRPKDEEAIKTMLLKLIDLNNCLVLRVVWLKIQVKTIFIMRLRKQTNSLVEKSMLDVIERVTAFCNTYQSIHCVVQKLTGNCLFRLRLVSQDIDCCGQEENPAYHLHERRREERILERPELDACIA